MPTDRELQIMRLTDAGVVLKHRANSSQRFGAVFDFARLPQTVLAPTLQSMVGKGWLKYDKEQGRYLLTPEGRDFIALRTRVRDFAQQGNRE